MVLDSKVRDEVIHYLTSHGVSHQDAESIVRLSETAGLRGAAEGAGFGLVTFGGFVLAGLPYAAAAGLLFGTIGVLHGIGLEVMRSPSASQVRDTVQKYLSEYMSQQSAS